MLVYDDRESQELDQPHDSNYDYGYDYGFEEEYEEESYTYVIHQDYITGEQDSSGTSDSD